MKCRRIKKWIDEQGVTHTNLVWFGSYGTKSNGQAKFYDDQNKHDNFSTNLEGVQDSLIQRLSVLKQELWYNIVYGMPLINNNVNSKMAVDSFIIDTVLNHPDVQSINQLESKVDKHNYYANISIKTNFGELNLNI